MKNALLALVLLIPISLFSQITLTPVDLVGKWDYYFFGIKKDNPVIFKSDGFVIGIKKDGKKLKYVMDNNVMVFYGWGTDKAYTQQEAVFVLYPSKDKKTIEVKKFLPEGLADLNIKLVSKSKKISLFKKKRSTKTEFDFIDEYIEGDLSSREVIETARVTEDVPNSDKVVIKICINRDGDLLETIFLTKGSTTTNKKLIQFGIDRAKRYKFKSDPKAPDKQYGTIIFRFSSN